MSKGIATFLTVRQATYDAVVARYQSYWPGTTVDGHGFYPFNAEAIISNSSGGQDSIGIEFATSAEIQSLVEAALLGGHLFELDFYQFVSTLDGSPPSNKTLFASFLGEIISATQTEGSISVQVGASLDPVNAQAPPRKFTTALVGEPPKI